MKSSGAMSLSLATEPRCKYSNRSINRRASSRLEGLQRSIRFYRLVPTFDLSVRFDGAVLTFIPEMRMKRCKDRVRDDSRPRVGVQFLCSLQNALHIRFRHRLSNLPVNHRPTRTIQKRAQVVASRPDSSTRYPYASVGAVAAVNEARSLLDGFPFQRSKDNTRTSSMLKATTLVQHHGVADSPADGVEVATRAGAPSPRSSDPAAPGRCAHLPVPLAPVENLPRATNSTTCWTGRRVFVEIVLTKSTTSSRRSWGIRHHSGFPKFFFERHVLFRHLGDDLILAGHPRLEARDLRLQLILTARRATGRVWAPANSSLCHV